MMAITAILASILFFIALREALKPYNEEERIKTAVRAVVLSFIVMVSYLVVFTIIALW